MPNRPDGLELAQLQADNADHLEALRHAGEKARRLRADVRRMSAVLGEVLNDPDVPERVRTLAREALEGDLEPATSARSEGDPE